MFETTVRLEVAGKGELQLAVDRYRGECISSALNLSRAFTITGGSGIYAGASGGGTVNHRASHTPSGSAGTDTWTGTLNVPGLEFDVTPPTLRGAVNKTVRARRGSKRVRVTYKVTARDAVDGAVPVSCKPRSGSRFKIGRTIVMHGEGQQREREGGTLQGDREAGLRVRPPLTRLSRRNLVPAPARTLKGPRSRAFSLSRRPDSNRGFLHYE